MFASGARANVRDAALFVVVTAEGAGGTTLVASALPPLRPVDETLGAGGTTFAASEFVADRPLAATLGGGGTTSCVPKSFPMILLTSDGDWLGGGGTTVAADLATPLSRRRRSRESADGGGATTDGAGKFSFAFLTSSRSGALTGGGTTATLFIRTRVEGTSAPFARGAGGTIDALSDGVARCRLLETSVEAGTTIFVLRYGAIRVC